MPAAVKHQRELGGDVQVIFVHSQQADQDTWESFAWRMKWMGNAAMWCEEAPLNVPGNTLPKTALIGVDGRLILQGNPGELGKRLTEALEAEIKKAKLPPEDAPAELKKAWAAFNKGDVAVAIAECDRLATPVALEARAEFVARSEARIARIARMVDEGHLHEAERKLAELEKGVKAHAELLAKLREVSARIADPSQAAEREASKAISTLLDKIALDKPFDAGNVKKVSALAEKYAGTKSAARAARFVELSRVKAGG